MSDLDTKIEAEIEIIESCERDINDLQKKISGWRGEIEDAQDEIQNLTKIIHESSVQIGEYRKQEVR